MPDSINSNLNPIQNEPAAYKPKPLPKPPNPATQKTDAVEISTLGGKEGVPPQERHISKAALGAYSKIYNQPKPSLFKELVSSVYHYLKEKFSRSSENVEISRPFNVKGHTFTPLHTLKNEEDNPVKPLYIDDLGIARESLGPIEEKEEISNLKQEIKALDLTIKNLEIKLQQGIEKFNKPRTIIPGQVPNIARAMSERKKWENEDKPQLENSITEKKSHLEEIKKELSNLSTPIQAKSKPLPIPPKKFVEVDQAHEDPIFIRDEVDSQEENFDALDDLTFDFDFGTELVAQDNQPSKKPSINAEKEWGNFNSLLHKIKSITQHDKLKLRDGELSVKERKLLNVNDRNLLLQANIFNPDSGSKGIKALNDALNQLISFAKNKIIPANELHDLIIILENQDWAKAPLKDDYTKEKLNTIKTHLENEIKYAELKNSYEQLEIRFSMGKEFLLDDLEKLENQVNEANADLKISTGYLNALK